MCPHVQATRLTKARTMSPAPVSAAWVLIGCILESLLIVARFISIGRGPTDLWACALPAYLPPASAAAAMLAPPLFLLPFAWISLRRSARTAHGIGRVALLVLPPVLVLAFPDRAGFIGDFLFRQGSVLGRNYPASFPQSLPLDRLVQGWLVPVLGARPLEGALPGARWLGLIACVAFSLVVARSSARPGADSAWRHLVWGCFVLAGYLCVFTGYARDVVESLPLTAILLFALVERLDARSQRSPAPELALAALLMLHRSALCLVPAYALVSLWPARDTTAARRNWRWLVGVAVLGLTIVVMGPRYVHLLWRFDLPRHAAWTSASGALPPIADPRSLWDLLNALLMLAPLAALAWLGPVSAASGRERGFMLAASLGWLIPMMLARPQQGAFRDYDVYAGAALTLAFVAVLGLERLAWRGRRVEKALIALSFVSTLQASLGLLLVSSDVAATEARVRHGLTIADARWTGANATMSEYLGLNAERRGQWRAAAQAYSDAARLAPSPLRLARAGRAAACAGDWQTSVEQFAALIDRDPTSAIGWSGYAGAQRGLANGRPDSVAETRLLELCRTRAQQRVAIAFLNYASALDSAGVLRAKLAAVR